MILLLTIGAGAAVAGIVGLVARRWPQVEAPRVSGETIVEEVKRHPGLAGHLRHHFNPKTETGIALTIAVALVVGAAVGIGIVLAMIRNHFGLASWDMRLARFGDEHATAVSTDVLRALSQFGGTNGVVLLAVVVCVVEYVRRPTRSLPLFLALVVGGQFALSNGIKFLVERARPDLNRLTGYAGTSFPSGHSTAAAATLAARRAGDDTGTVAPDEGRRRGGGGRAGHDGGGDAGVSRRALVHRRRRRPAARMGLVRAVFDRVRGPLAELRPSRSTRPRRWRASMPLPLRPAIDRHASIWREEFDVLRVPTPKWRLAGVPCNKRVMTTRPPMRTHDGSRMVVAGRVGMGGEAAVR